MTSSHVHIGQWGESLVAQRLSDVAPVQPGERADLRFAGIEIEVKTALPSKADRDRSAPRFQFCLHRQGEGRKGMQGDVLVLVLAPSGTCYVIPRGQVPDVRTLHLGPQSTRFEFYRENWSVLADCLETL